MDGLNDATSRIDRRHKQIQTRIHTVLQSWKCSKITLFHSLKQEFPDELPPHSTPGVVASIATTHGGGGMREKKRSLGEAWTLFPDLYPRHTPWAETVLTETAAALVISGEILHGLPGYVPNYILIASAHLCTICVCGEGANQCGVRGAHGKRQNGWRAFLERTNLRVPEV
uniref:Transposase n=1 Tax=Steinernema glaseri TaxID=37863 RepID=A0A1I7Z1I2_9BILA